MVDMKDHRSVRVRYFDLKIATIYVGYSCVSLKHPEHFSCVEVSLRLYQVGSYCFEDMLDSFDIFHSDSFRVPPSGRVVGIGQAED